LQDLVPLLKRRVRLERSKRRLRLRLDSSRILPHLVEVVLASSSRSRQHRLVAVLLQDLVALRLPLDSVPLKQGALANLEGQRHLVVDLHLEPSQLRLVSVLDRLVLLQPEDLEVLQ